MSVPRLRITRRYTGTASTPELRRRGEHVIGVGPWLVFWIPRNHWTRHL